MNFTHKERQVLYHRLGAPETIAKALKRDLSETERDCNYLTYVIAGSRGLVVSALNEVERRILIDCVQGSTWAIGWEHKGPSYYAACQTLTKLARKFEAEGLGSNIVVPT